VGADMTARTDSRFLSEDKPGYLATFKDLGVEPATIARIDASGHAILNQKIDTDAVTAALSGERGTKFVKDYGHVDVMSAYGLMMWPACAGRF
jgi:methyl-accepting chemotaxis protein